MSTPGAGLSSEVDPNKDVAKPSRFKAWFRRRRRIESSEDLQRRDERQEVNLKRVYGYGAALIVAAQVALADYAFFRFAVAESWRLSDGALAAWLSATVVQIVAIVAIISKYLFSKDSGVKGSGTTSEESLP